MENKQAWGVEQVWEGLIFPIHCVQGWVLEAPSLGLFSLHWAPASAGVFESMSVVAGYPFLICWTSLTSLSSSLECEVCCRWDFMIVHDAGPSGVLAAR